MPERYERTVSTLADRRIIVEELARYRAFLIGRDAEVDNVFPKQTAKYVGRILNVELREDKVFLDLQTKPKEVKRLLIGSTSETVARELAQHIRLTRIKIK